MSDESQRPRSVPRPTSNPGLRPLTTPSGTRPLPRLTPASQALLRIDRAWGAALPRPAPPGSFDWWRVDARNSGGDGLVLTWASQLPFFPHAEPTINVAIYKKFKPTFWLLQQYPRDELYQEEQEGGFRLVLEHSWFSLGRMAGGVLRLEAHLDLAMPGERRRLTGTIRAEGQSALLEQPPIVAAHRWVPLAPIATVAADLRLGDTSLFSWFGEGYVDRNIGDAPLKDLGLRRWQWGRARRGTTCTAWYALEGRDGEREAWRLDANAQGITIGEAGKLRREHRGLMRLGDLLIDEGPAVEKLPFYRRGFGTLSGVPALSESFEVDAIGDLSRVNRRVHRVRAQNSFWAPFFSGPREGRLRRLLRLGGK